MLDDTLKKIARRVLSLDEASLQQCLGTYKKRMDEFNSDQEWEEAVIIYFLINAVRVKNALFNEQVLKLNQGAMKKADKPTLVKIK